jgi:hypothetical protein
VVDDGCFLTRIHDTMRFHGTLYLSAAAAADADACVHFLLRALSHSTYPVDVRISENGCDMRCPRLSSVIFLPAAGAESLFCAGQYCSWNRANAIGGDDWIGYAVGTDASQPGWLVVIAQVLVTLRANDRYCDVRCLKTKRGSECGVAKGDLDGDAMANASESGCDDAGGGGDDAKCGGSCVGSVGWRAVSDARRSWVQVRESRGHEDRGPSRRRAHGRETGEREMCCRVGRWVVDVRLQSRQRQRLKCQSQAASLYRDAGDGEALALWMDRATCCDCANDTDHASQHLPLLQCPPTRALSLIRPF